MMGGFEILFAILCAIPLLLLVAVATAGYLGVRAVRPPRAAHDSARDLLDRRLALGEINADEYLERESILRQAAPASPPRRRAWRR